MRKPLLLLAAALMVSPVFAQERGDGERGRGGPPSPSDFIDRFDKNGDGHVSKDEVPEQAWQFVGRADANKDGKITKEEIDNGMKEMRERFSQSRNGRGGDRPSFQRPSGHSPGRGPLSGAGSPRTRAGSDDSKKADGDDDDDDDDDDD
ncbi:MAG: hypothetical protein ACI9HK_004457, partial [Pirellulaceae bacterium]